MHRPVLRLLVALVGLSLLLVPPPSMAELVRVPNVSLNMPANLPGNLYTSTNALGNLIFTNPVAIVSPPGETNRLFVVEKRGRIVVITNLAAPTRTIFMDIDPVVTSGTDTDVGNEQGLLGLAFHPQYASNGFFYVFYTGNDNTGVGGTTRHDILSRFSVSPTDPNQGLSGSEVKLLRQKDDASNHNAGDLHFGPDGYLYVSLGDEGIGNDSLDNSQTITKDFFSGILRIDVDKKPGSLAPNSHPSVTSNYAVPPDNPFVGATSFNGIAVNSNQVHTEFWAVGLRNPWRYSFDPVTGLLYCGDVGQSGGTAREEIDIIERGGNYGWAYREGTGPGPKSGSAPPGFTSIDPILEYTHSEGVAITGGVVYRGNRIASLYGAYVFGDYNGGLWMTRYNGTDATPKTLLFVDNGISAFGIDPSNGDVLYADLNGGNNGTIDRIIPTSQTGTPLPPTLADTGAFTDLVSLTPEPGIVDYDINVPFWSDTAIKSRWFSVPNTNQAIGFERDSNWTLPSGSVWVKHFELELTNGVPASRKRLETRFIVRNNEGVYGATYRWGDSTTNATLVPEQGLDEAFVIDDGGGILRTQVWHYPSRVECVRCHTSAGGLALGFNTGQMNRDHDYNGDVTNQIMALSDAGYFSRGVTNRHILRALAPADDEAVSLNFRVRSYLSANCAQCHQPGGTAQGATWDGRITTPTSQAGIINGPLNVSGGDTEYRVIVSGDPAHSEMLARISSLGPDRMPPLDSNVLDTNAIQLLTAWITNELSGYRSFEDFQVFYFGSTNAPDAAAGADPDFDFASNTNEWLTHTVPTNAASVWDVGIELAGGTVRIGFDQIANRGFEVQSVDNLEAPQLWQPLDIPENVPFFSITNRAASVPDTIDDADFKAYRVKVFEP